LKAPVVEKDADAEVLFWDVRMDDAEQDLVFAHYIRIKVFTERGRESQSKIDITYTGDTKVKDVAARTIKPDGQIVEVKKEDVFERTIIKMSGLKVKAKSFAMPGVEPGAIIEYKWREVTPGAYANHEHLDFQREIPIQKVSYHIKPLNNPYISYAMRYQAFHMPSVNAVKEKDGFYNLSLTNVPAFHEEPRMPPEDQVRAWALVYYSEDKKLAPAAYWKERGKEVYEAAKSYIKPNDDVKKKAAELVADAKTDEEKLQRLFDFCRTSIKNVNDDASGLTATDREKLKENKSSGDTLKRGMGTGLDIDSLFIALATAAGFEARPVLLSDRSRIFFDPGFTDSYFLRGFNTAVRVGGEWRFFDPASTYVPFGMLRWQEENLQALIADPKEPAWVETPLSPPEKSMEKRAAKLSLSEDGTLEGEARIEYTGQLAAERKEDADDDSPQQREQNLRDRIKEHMSTAELSDIKIENITDATKPLVYSYHVKVPGYAQRTGKRLFLQPAFFQRGAGALFPVATRQSPIYFHYPWSEDDNVTIELPAGFALDNADAPPGINAGEVSQYGVKITVTNKKTLNYHRTFFFGGGSSIFFPATSYTQIKAVFDTLHERDGHTIVLKQSAVAAN
ncbi:MAG: DUF3857 domain-containing protein, partial [Pyrinomonadaceae bacterium]